MIFDGLNICIFVNRKSLKIPSSKCLLYWQFQEYKLAYIPEMVIVNGPGEKQRDFSAVKEACASGKRKVTVLLAIAEFREVFCFRKPKIK